MSYDPNPTPPMHSRERAYGPPCPFCKQVTVRMFDHYPQSVEWLRCRGIDCGYEIEAKRENETWIVTIIEPGKTYTASVNVMQLRADGLTADGRKWERFKI